MANTLNFNPESDQSLQQLLDKRSKLDFHTYMNTLN